MNWSPTAQELEDLNLLRKLYGLPEVNNITTAEQWWDACNEIDVYAGIDTEPE